jgi:hypothetical protein
VFVVDAIELVAVVVVALELDFVLTEVGLAPVRLELFVIELGVLPVQLDFVLIELGMLAVRLAFVVTELDQTSVEFDLFAEAEIFLACRAYPLMMLMKFVSVVRIFH